MEGTSGTPASRPRSNRAKMEMEHKELIAFVGTLIAALSFVFLSRAYPHYAMVAGIAIISTVLLVLLFKTLESKNVFGKNMTYVWMALVFGFMMVFTTLLNQGILPYWIYSTANPLAVTVSNALIYALLTVTVLALVYVAYVYKTGKNPIKQRFSAASIHSGKSKYFRKF